MRTVGATFKHTILLFYSISACGFGIALPLAACNSQTTSPLGSLNSFYPNSLSNFLGSHQTGDKKREVNFSRSQTVGQKSHNGVDLLFCQQFSVRRMNCRINIFKT